MGFSNWENAEVRKAEVGKEGRVYAIGNKRETERWINARERPFHSCLERFLTI